MSRTANPAAMRVSRNERRLLLAAEARARKTGRWGQWETLSFPAGSVGSGWASEFTTAHRNAVFSVLDRTLPNGVRHLAVASLSEERPSWHEMQRIKDEIAGDDATAVEVYPPHDQIVDGANMFHLWVLPEPLSFGLYTRPRNERQRIGEQHGRSRQTVEGQQADRRDDLQGHRHRS